MNSVVTEPESNSASSEKTPIYYFDASSSRFDYAFEDLKRAFARPKLIWSLIRTGFFTRYHGTVLGGLWVTATTGITISGLAVLYGQIFGANLTEYFPYVAVGIVVWGLISTIINDGASVFLAAAGTFNQSPIPKSLFVVRAIGIAALGFCYKLIVIAAVVLAVGLRPSLGDVALASFGLLLVFWTGFWFALGLGTIGTRFRDIGQLTSAGLTFAFFVTPVFWQASRLGEYQFIVNYNPLAHFLNVVRGPLLGLDGVMTSVIWASGFSALATIFGVVTFGYFARRLCYWS
ncbi:ABC transporter permease [Hyphococcus formosus]|uniref:ABC transporter permease n=1 Tax=Hyphococcus formosus TaxID=3143534 RepID=UPI00398AA7D1